MDRAGVEAYLHRHIPISVAMGVRVREASGERIVLGVPLEPNLNHQATAFGGSLSALAILAGWTLVHLRLDGVGLPSRTVIQRSEVRYLAPVTGAFEAVCEAPDADTWARFVETLARRGRARIELAGRVLQEGHERALLAGAYVAFAGEPE